MECWKYTGFLRKFLMSKLLRTLFMHESFNIQIDFTLFCESINLHLYQFTVHALFGSTYLFNAFVYCWNCYNVVGGKRYLGHSKQMSCYANQSSHLLHVILLKSWWVVKANFELMAATMVIYVQLQFTCTEYINYVHAHKSVSLLKCVW